MIRFASPGFARAFFLSAACDPRSWAEWSGPCLTSSLETTWEPTLVITCTQVISFFCACQAPYCSIVRTLFYALFRRKSLILKECSIVPCFLHF